MTVPRHPWDFSRTEPRHAAARASAPPGAPPRLELGVAGLVLACSQALGCAQPPTTPVTSPEHLAAAPRSSGKATPFPSRLLALEHQRDLALSKYESLGLELGTRAYPIQLLSPAAFAQGIGGNARHFEVPGLYDALSATARLLGASVGRSPDELRTLAPLSLGALALAYYDFDRKVLVLRDGPKHELLSPDEVVAHELGHAYQDLRQGGIARYIDAHRESADALRAAHAVLEGEASLLAESVTLSELGLGLEALDPELTDPSLGRLTTGEAYSLIYDAGRRFLLHHYGKAGLAGILRGYQSPPSSTEQLLHPEKFERDAPRTVELPPAMPHSPGSRLLFDGTLGEMLIYSRLLSVTKELHQARLAATGWDGDRLQVFKFENGSYGLRWQIVWDRVVDAEQFSALVRPLLPGVSLCNLWVQGNVTSLVYAETPEEAEQLRSSTQPLTPNHVPSIVAEDARSTELAEAVYTSRHRLRPRVMGTRWVWQTLGLSFEVPEGFFDVDINGVCLLASLPKDDFANNITVTFEQDLYVSAPDRFLSQQRQSLEKSGQIWLGSRPAKLLGTQAVVIETQVLTDTQAANAVVLSIPRGNGVRLSIVVATRSGERELAQKLMTSIESSLAFESVPDGARLSAR